MSTTAATVLTVPTWTFLTLSRNLVAVPPVAASGSTPAIPGSLAPSLVASLTSGSQRWLGDAQGNPQQLIPDQPGQTPAWTSGQLDLSEVVTRADGTKLAVSALLDSIAMAAATPAAS